MTWCCWAEGATPAARKAGDAAGERPRASISAPPSTSPLRQPPRLPTTTSRSDSGSAQLTGGRGLRPPFCLDSLRPRAQFLPQVGGDQLALEAAILYENFVGAGPSDDHAGHVNSRHIALQRFRIAHRPALLA